MWLEDFRRAHGLTLEELGAYIRRLGRKKHPEITVSDTLLERLEGEPKFRTVPAIADLIAEACGATAEQRDQLVLEKHKGTWKPKPGRKPQVKAGATREAVEEEEEPWRINNGTSHPVVAVDREGFAVRRYEGVQSAATHCGTSPHAVYSRCLRQMGRGEFRMLGFTFRYAGEWDRMTDAERRADVAGGKDRAATPRPAAPEAGESTESRATHREGEEAPPKKNPVHYQRGVVAVDRQGHEVARWAMVKDAYRDTRVAVSTISKSISRRRNDPYVRGVDLAFVDAGEWDGMTEAQRRARLELD